MKKIKICYAISSLANQGPPNVLYNIIRYMDFEKFDVTILTMVNEPEVTRIDDFRQLPIRIVQMSPDKVQNPIAMYLTLRKRIKEIDPDIIHGHCPRSMFLDYFLPQKYKKVQTIHCFPQYLNTVLYGKFKGRIVNILSNFFTMHLDKPIACAESVAEWYKDRFGYLMFAIENGSSMPIWNYNAKEKGILRSQLGLSGKVFLFVGRFSKEKNPDLIIKAFNDLRMRDSMLVMLGDGVMYNELKKYESKNIIMPGFKKNVYDYLKASDFYISLSETEGMPNTIVEGMTIGLPMVLSDIPSHREVMKKMEKTVGDLCDQHNIGDVKRAISKVMKLDMDEVRNEIHKVFSKHFTAEKMSEEYQKAYIEIMNK